ncbi:MAG: DMT family transporter [Alphaproteobacteria bacterium]
MSHVSPGIARRHAALLPFYALMLAAGLWGGWWIPLRMLDARGIARDWAGLAFYAVAAAALLPFVLYHWRRVAAAAGPLLLIALSAGPASAAFNHAVITSGVVRAVLLFYLAPIWATVLARIVLKERIGPQRAVSIALGIAGSAVVLGLDDQFAPPGSLGEYMGLAAGFLWALAMTWTRKAAEVSALDKTFATLAGCCLASVGLALLLPGAEAPAWAALGEAAWIIVAAAILWLVPFSVLEFWGASRMDPGRTCIVLLVEVVVSAVTATALAGEAFGWREAVGSLLIVGAGFIEVRDQARAPARA